MHVQWFERDKILSQVETICISGIWLRCDKGSLGPIDLGQDSGMAQFYSGGVPVIAEIKSISAFSVGMPMVATMETGPDEQIERLSADPPAGASAN